nr:hypothetical protein [Aliihoeflea aestuarii]
MTPPRAALTRIASGFISASVSRLIRLRVEALNSQFSVTTSDARKSSSKGAKRTPAARSSSALSFVRLV